MSYSTVEYGTCYTDNYRLYFKNEAGEFVSPFHDIPLYHDKGADGGANPVFNMVCEIPRWTNAKMEISTKDKMNPIKQDVKKGKVRFVKNSFPYRGYMWNYGALPQTWEDPSHVDQHTQQKGDGDPIDVVEIGYKVAYRGQVKQVKVLGIMAMIDEGETDWKLIAIDINDPLAKDLNDIADVRTHMPGLIEATHDWFRTYKMPGSPDTKPNEFAFSGKAKDKAFALEIIQQTYDQWKTLVEGSDTRGFACENTSVGSSQFKVPGEDAAGAVNGLPVNTPPATLPHDVDMMYYLSSERKMGAPVAK